MTRHWRTPGTVPAPTIALALALALALAFAFATWPAHAAPPAHWPRMTGDSPLHADALPPARVAAIVEEARRVAAEQDAKYSDTPVTPLPQAWRTLDRETLAALIRMPDWETIHRPDATFDTRGILLQQVAAWDLIDFRRPSDAARLWRHLWPDAVSRPVENDRQFPFGIGYSPDPSWALRPRAMAALIGCLPHEAWDFDGDVMVERSRRRWADSDRGPGVFRACVERTARFLESDEGYGPPHDPPGIGEAVAALLKDRFAAEVFQDGCSRPGPDGCLVLMDALLSLDPDDPRLPGLFRRLEPGFRLDDPIEVPAVPAPPEDTPWDAPSPWDAALEVPEGEALRRMVYLRLKVRQLLHRPENWPPGELDRALAQAARAGLALNAARDRMSGARQRQVYGIDPVAWLRDLLPPAVTRRVAASQAALGRELAHAPDCALFGAHDEWEPFTGTPELRAAYRDARRRMGRPCE